MQKSDVKSELNLLEKLYADVIGMIDLEELNNEIKKLAFITCIVFFDNVKNFGKNAIVNNNTILVGLPALGVTGNIQGQVAVYIKDDIDIAIIEMGANHIGEIKTLCEIAMPDFGLITNYGYAHLEGFGDFEGVIKGKSEIFDYLTQNYGHIILNNDDTLQLENCKGDLAITYGQKVDSEFIFKYKKEDDFLLMIL